MRSILMILCLSMILAAAVPASADEAAKREAIRQTALDYIEGWYEGDAERMERALHPELAKRAVMTDPESGRSKLDHMSAMTLVQYTRAGYGKHTPVEDRKMDVTILDIYENAAVVKVVADAWIDYMQIAKFNGKWVIVNVLWELSPKEGN